MEDITQHTDFLVESGNPEYLDDTLQQLPMMRAYVLGRGLPGGIMKREGYPIVRVFGDTKWFKYAVGQQGYCRIIKEIEREKEETHVTV